MPKPIRRRPTAKTLVAQIYALLHRQLEAMLDASDDDTPVPPRRRSRKT